MPGSRTKTTFRRSAGRSGRYGFSTQAPVGAAPGTGSGLAATLFGGSVTTGNGAVHVTLASPGRSPTVPSGATSTTFNAIASPATAERGAPEVVTIWGCGEPEPPDVPPHATSPMASAPAIQAREPRSAITAPCGSRTAGHPTAGCRCRRAAPG